jgi:acyl phosphate:glycerol-3-phosphate acyltransferase
MLVYVLTAATGYLLGSIPFGFLLVRAFRGTDIRQSGSGNIGATNVARTSPVLGVVTLILDALKGLAAVAIARYWIAPNFAPSAAPLLSGLAALCAVAGHVFPVWLRFRGGKGVATGLGSFLLLAPKSLLVMIGLFLGVVFAFRYVSLGSIVAVAFLPLLAWLLDGYQGTPAAIVFMVIACFIIIGKHHDNIRRLASGTENRFSLRRG